MAQIIKEVKYIMKWKYDDNSGSGIFNRILNEDQKNLIKIILTCYGDLNKDFSFAEIKEIQSGEDFQGVLEDE